MLPMTAETHEFYRHVSVYTNNLFSSRLQRSRLSSGRVSTISDLAQIRIKSQEGKKYGQYGAFCGPYRVHRCSRAAISLTRACPNVHHLVDRRTAAPNIWSFFFHVPMTNDSVTAIIGVRLAAHRGVQRIMTNLCDRQCLNVKFSQQMCFNHLDVTRCECYFYHSGSLSYQSGIRTCNSYTYKSYIADSLRRDAAKV